MKKKINITLDDVTYERLKEYSKQDHRSCATEMALILELYRPGMIPGISVTTPGPGVSYAPTQAQGIPGISSSPEPNPSQMTGLEQQEYARKQAAEAKTKIALEKQEARSQAKTLTPEEQELNQQKLELQKQKIQEKRDKLVRDRAMELDLWDAENYSEDRVFNNYYLSDYATAKMNERDYGIPNPYTNPPKPIEELYDLLDKLKQEEIDEKAEEDRRDALPHDRDDYDYKSEDFEYDVKELQSVWIERGYGVPNGYDDEDYKILYNYFYNNHLYRDFVYRMSNPYTGFDIDDDATLLSNIFNRDIKDIDMQYINALMCGRGRAYRDENNLTSYYEQYQAQRAEWQRIIDESKTKKYKTEI